MTMDSTTSEIMQDNSSTECVSSETHPTTTVQNNELIFGQKHNDTECALCPTAKRACDRAWVTAKQIENWSGMSTTTLWRRLKKLDEVGRICSFSDLKNCKMPTNNGGMSTCFRYETRGHTDRNRRLESILIDRDSSLCFRPLVGESGKPSVCFRYETD